ncbi:MAG: hypothetical protein WBL58_00625 [Peptococcia bacterium]
MEEKVYDLLEKMYVDLNGKMEKMYTDLKSDLRRVEHNLIRMENKMDERFKALFDGYALAHEKDEATEKRLDNIEDKIEEHDIRIRAVEVAGR